MDIPILIEKLAANRYSARAGAPFALSAEDVTPEKAAQRLQQLIEERLRAGAQMITLNVAWNGKSPLPGAGIFKDDPVFDDVVRIMAENRQKEDEDPLVP